MTVGTAGFCSNLIMPTNLAGFSQISRISVPVEPPAAAVSSDVRGASRRRSTSVSGWRTGGSETRRTKQARQQLTHSQLSCDHNRSLACTAAAGCRRSKSIIENRGPKPFCEKYGLLLSRYCTETTVVILVIDMTFIGRPNPIVISSVLCARVASRATGFRPFSVMNISVIAVQDYVLFSSCQFSPVFLFSYIWSHAWLDCFLFLILVSHCPSTRFLLFSLPFRSN